MDSQQDQKTEETRAGLSDSPKPVNNSQLDKFNYLEFWFSLHSFLAVIIYGVVLALDLQELLLCGQTDLWLYGAIIYSSFYIIILLIALISLNRIIKCIALIIVLILAYFECWFHLVFPIFMKVERNYDAGLFFGPHFLLSFFYLIQMVLVFMMLNEQSEKVDSDSIDV